MLSLRGSMPSSGTIFWNCFFSFWIECLNSRVKACACCEAFLNCEMISLACLDSGVKNYVRGVNPDTTYPDGHLEVVIAHAEGVPGLLGGQGELLA
jgi:hypothetical protein